MNRTETIEGLRSVIVPGFMLRCRICFSTIAGASVGAVARLAADEGWEITRYDPKIHTKIGRTEDGDRIATCFNHSENAIHL